MVLLSNLGMMTTLKVSSQLNQKADDRVGNNAYINFQSTQAVSYQGLHQFSIPRVTPMKIIMATWIWRTSAGG